MDIEKLGVFYLGTTANGPLLYSSPDLTTHGVCVGMTGSGKTGLCVDLIEEAAIDGIPVIAIDPKGDLANLLLDAPTEEIPGRIARLRSAVEMIVYTPGSDAGVPLALLRSLEAPATRLAPEALRERIQSTTAALFGLAGVETSGPTARESVLLQSLLADAWAAGRSLDLAALIAAVQAPPFRTIGVMDVDTFFPVKDRFELAMALNALLASPTAAQWLSGEPIDTDKLLYGNGGKPRVSIISIAHLSDQERMAVVTVLLGNVIAWMRGQTGTTSLRAMLFMDECAGYLPPVAAPPSKPLFLTLFKQARAFGLGVVVASQNPVDVDYKVLSNAGTWWIGRLQTERDREKVLTGLIGAAEQGGGSLQRAEYEQLIAGLEKRQFIQYSARADRPEIFKTRLALSELRGPMSLAELRELRKPSPQPRSAQLPSPGGRGVVEPGITQLFVPAVGEQGELRLRPAIVGAVRVRYVKQGIDVTRVFAAPVQDGIVAVDWTQSETLAIEPKELSAKVPVATFEPIPPAAARAESYAAWRRALVDWVAATQRLELLSALDLTSTPGESERDFAVRLQLARREERDAAVAALEKKLGAKIEAAQERVRKARQAVEKKEKTASDRQTSAMLDIGSSMLGMLMGKASISRVTTAAKGAKKLAAGEKDVAHAEENVRVAEEKLQTLSDELARATAAIASEHSVESLKIVKTFVAAKKSDVELLAFGLGWLPYRVTPAGGELAAYARQVR